MKLSATLYLSQKGEIELKTRSYKLGMKKRSLLILLDRAQTIEAVLAKSVLQEAECLEEIQALLREDFISLDSSKAVAPTGRSAPAISAKAGFYLVEDIILSEAKFLLVDFCVDHFGTHSQSFVDSIRGASTIDGIQKCLEMVAEQVEKTHPKLQPTLMALVTEINNTA